MNATETTLVPTAENNVEQRPTTTYECVCAAPEDPIAVAAHKQLVRQLVQLIEL